MSVGCFLGSTECTATIETKNKYKFLQRNKESGERYKSETYEKKATPVSLSSRNPLFRPIITRFYPITRVSPKRSRWSVTISSSALLIFPFTYLIMCGNWNLTEKSGYITLLLFIKLSNLCFSLLIGYL